jgi:hypothetical protein
MFLINQPTLITFIFFEEEKAFYLIDTADYGSLRQGENLYTPFDLRLIFLLMLQRPENIFGTRTISRNLQAIIPSLHAEHTM